MRFPALGRDHGRLGRRLRRRARRALRRPHAARTGAARKTSLERKVPAHFGLERRVEVGEAIHRGAHPDAAGSSSSRRSCSRRRRATSVAAEIVDRLADEVVALARAALVRLDLTEEPVEIAARRRAASRRGRRLIERIDAGLREVGPRLVVRADERPRRSSGRRCSGSTSSASTAGAHERALRERARRGGRSREEVRDG